MAEYVVGYTDNLDPTHVRERVVRRRDCVYAEPMPLSYSDRLICAHFDDMSVEPGGFCAWGRERED